MKKPIRFDEYYLVERIAVGGMAEVFKGVTYSEEGFERQMAVKRVLPHIAEDKDFIEMFIDEAKLVSQLQHPNIPQVYHLGKFDEQYFISMEFISGQDVRSIFDRARSQNIQLDLGICAHIIMEVCEALDYAHRKTNANREPLHLIHRDVSPQNIIVSYDGTIKLIDFGIAKAVGQINQTQAGILKGKFSYMSPEQARGYTIDARSDLFGLGAVLYELVTLERCFLGQSDFSTIERVRNTEYKLPRKIRRDIPSQLEKIVRKALAKDPNDRFQSAADFQEALRVFVRTQQNQRNRGQVQTYLSTIFQDEILGEKERIQAFRAYAAEHIPEAQRHYDSRRFQKVSTEHLRSDANRPRFALDNQIKLSLDPNATIDTPSYHQEHAQITSEQNQAVSVSFFAKIPFARITLLILLAILTGSIIAAISWIKQPLPSAIIFDDPQGLHPKYVLTGEGENYEGIAPRLLKIIKPGNYNLQLSLDKGKKINQSIDLIAGQILRVSSTGENAPQARLLDLSSSPSNAEIYLGTQLLGVTPLKVQVGQQPKVFTAKAPGYLDQTVSVRVTKDRASKHISLLPKSVRARILSNVDGAQIELESPPLSKQWTGLTLNQAIFNLNNEKTQRIRVKAQGYEEQIITVHPSFSKQLTRWVALKPTSSAQQPIQDIMSSTSSAILLPVVNSKTTVGIEEIKEVTDPNIALPSTKKKQRKKPRSKRRKRPRQVKQKTKHRRSVVKKAPPKKDSQPGFLKLIAIPPAEVFIDGKSAGWTPLINYKLTEGNHKIRLRFQNGQEKVINQTISAGRVSLRRVKN